MFNKIELPLQLVYQNTDVTTRRRLRGVCIGFNEKEVQIYNEEKLQKIMKHLDGKSRGMLRLTFNNEMIQKNKKDYDECYDKLKTGYYYTRKDYGLIGIEYGEKSDDKVLYDYEKYGKIYDSARTFLEKYEGYYVGIDRVWRKTVYK